MKIMIDTNILISSALSNNGTPYNAYVKAVSYPNQGIVCDQNIEELKRIFNRKFPAKIPLMNQFLATALMTLTVVKTPADEISDEKLIRDTADRPILRAARAANADILITGDKDFLESDVINPRIMTAAEFLNQTE
ncbi:MAG TPA: putative toxin-antitoxin system toxin component, PIN family [Ruminococcus sp.]|nr:putative toxin-antitoxin system toxin component, PIN family [Ruminococcus sp.]